jgi:hypothetical protein
MQTDDGQSRGIRIRQRPHENSVGDCKDPGQEPDSHCQRQHGGHDEAARTDQSARGVSEIAPQTIHRAD